MKHILLTNDDGYQAIGFYPLLKELSKKFKITAVAPDRKRSWQGKSITCYHELEVEKVKLEEFDIYITSGTPADCVQLGLHNLDLGKIDFVVSGINIGLNAGHGRLFSSGTAGAAIEAAIHDTKSLAASLNLSHEHDKEINYFDPKFYHVYDEPAKITAKIVEKVLAQDLSEDIDVISVNIPFAANLNTEIDVTSIARDKYGQLFEKHGEKYKYGSSKNSFLKKYPEGTDMNSLLNNRVSVTPINLDLTSEKGKNHLEKILSH
jgi:5'-nucleotidase